MRCTAACVTIIATSYNREARHVLVQDVCQERFLVRSYDNSRIVRSETMFEVKNVTKEDVRVRKNRNTVENKSTICVLLKAEYLR